MEYQKLIPENQELSNRDFLPVKALSLNDFAKGKPLLELKNYFIIVLPDKEKEASPNSLKHSSFISIERKAHNNGDTSKPSLTVTLVDDLKNATILSDQREFYKQLVQLSFPSKQIAFLEVNPQTT